MERAESNVFMTAGRQDNMLTDQDCQVGHLTNTINIATIKHCVAERFFCSPPNNPSAITGWAKYENQRSLIRPLEHLDS